MTEAWVYQVLYEACLSAAEELGADLADLSWFDHARGVEAEEKRAA